MMLQARQPFGPVARRPRPATVVLLVAVAVAAVVGGSLAAGSAGHSHVAVAAAPHPVAASEAPSGGRPAVAPMKLPQPTGHLGAVPTGYPQTLQGAVAAAYGYSRIATSLDAATALRTVDTIADPASGWFNQAKHDEAVAGVIAQRQKLGLAPAGPTGGASLAVTPSGYQILRGPTSTAANVLTLNIISLVAADGTTTSSGLLVYRWALRWDGNRWRASAVYLTDADQTLAVTPLTAAARGKGWREADGG